MGAIGMEHSELAKQYFSEGYNCAQAVFLAFSDITGFDTATAAKLSSGFGGGFGRMREVCGAFSGAVMVLSMLYGYDDPKDGTAKSEHYQRIQAFGTYFREKNGSIICRDLLSGINAGEGGAPTPRTPEFYTNRPCAKFVSMAADFVNQYIAEHPPEISI